MKARLILWDMDGMGEKWVNSNIHSDRVNIVQIIPSYEKNIQLYNGEIDLLLVAAQSQYDEIISMLENVCFPCDKVVFIYEIFSWYQKFDQAVYLLKDFPGSMRRLVFWLYECKQKDYLICKVEELTFIASGTDEYIMPKMLRDGQVWSADEMTVFYKLAHKYYELQDDEIGYFLDLGANIGTTSIYFRKKLDENVKIIAFEPDVRNNRLLHINMQLNGLADESLVETYGLSNHSEKKLLYYDENNPGGTSLIRKSSNQATEVALIALDDYFADEQLDAAKIKYIWIDTEGFEPWVVGGARNILKYNDIPLYMEFNPYLWNKEGVFHEIIFSLQEVGYTGYIMVQEYMKDHKSVLPLDDLWTFQAASRDYIRDIFLIKGKEKN